MSPTLDRPTVLVTARLPAAFADALAERYDVIGPPPPPFDTRALDTLPPAALAHVRAMVTMGTVGPARR